MPRRGAIKYTGAAAITVTREALTTEKLVYIAASPRPRRYRFGQRSSILYIGTTKAGVRRIAESAATTAKRFLGDHGVRQIECYVVHCRPRQRALMWKLLERALLITFKHEYGEVPVGNTKGKNMTWSGEERYFSKERLRKIIRDFEG